MERPFNLGGREQKNYGRTKETRGEKLEDIGRREILAENGGEEKNTVDSSNKNTVETTNKKNLVDASNTSRFSPGLEVYCSNSIS